MRPPCSLGSMPWRTAFSTSVSNAIGGKRSASSAGSTSMRDLQAGRACACASGRGRRARAASSSRSADRPPSCSCGIAARRYAIRLFSTGGARGEPLSTSACTLASVLNRKCGSICACSSRQPRVERLALEPPALDLELQRLRCAPAHRARAPARPALPTGRCPERSRRSTGSRPPDTGCRRTTARRRWWPPDRRSRWPPARPAPPPRVCASQRGSNVCRNRPTPMEDQHQHQRNEQRARRAAPVAARTKIGLSASATTTARPSAQPARCRGGVRATRG